MTNNNTTPLQSIDLVFDRERRIAPVSVAQITKKKNCFVKDKNKFTEIDLDKDKDKHVLIEIKY